MEKNIFGNYKTDPCYCIRYEEPLTLTLSPLRPIIPVIPLKPCGPYSNKTSTHKDIERHTEQEHMGGKDTNDHNMNCKYIVC